MKNYGMLSEEYISDLIYEDTLSLEESKSKQPEGFFSVRAIKNIPYIEYQGLTKQQNLFAMKMAEEVLIRSRKENNYKEVAITYSLDDPDGFVVVKGSKDRVSFLDDPETADLLRKSAPLMIVSLHNHPNNSEMSFTDLAQYFLKFWRKPKQTKQR